MKHDINYWIDSVLDKHLPKIEAFNFNLYEGQTSFHIQLIGTETYDPDDFDWACDEIFSTEENVFKISREETGASWEDGLSYIIGLISEYLKDGKYSSKLKSAKAVGVGFVDGDIEILYEQ